MRVQFFVVQGSIRRLAVASTVFNVLIKAFVCFFLLLLQSFLREEVEVAFFGPIVSDFFSERSEVAQIPPGGRDGREEIEMDAREADFHNPQLLVRLRIVQMLYEDSKCVNTGFCRSRGGVNLSRGGGFSMYVHSCAQVTCTSCLFSCNQHLCVVVASANHRHRPVIGCASWCWRLWLSLALCRAILGRIRNSECFSGFHSLEASFELTEDLVVLPVRGINSLEFILSKFGDDASFRFVVDECVEFCKSLGCNILMMQGLSGELYHSLASFVSRVFLFQNVDVLFCLSSRYVQFCVQTAGFRNIWRRRCRCNLRLLCDLGKMRSLIV